MRIILVNRYFFPDQSATSRMVSSLAFFLAQKGYAVTALASQSMQEGHAALPRRERIEGVDVHRLKTSVFGRTRLAGRAADYLSFQAAAAAWLLRYAARRDVCVVCTDPPLLAVAVAPSLRLRGAHLVNWVMDLFPETAIELGVVSDTSALARSSLALRDRSLRSATLTICPMQAMTDHLQRRIGPTGCFATVRHWANDGEIHPVDPAENRLRAEWGLEDAFVVGYSGNFGRAHEFATLLGAAEALRGRTDIRFLMIGDGQQRAATEAETRRLGLTNVIFKPYQPVARLAHSLGAADVHIVSLLPGLEHCVVPSKFYGILAAGRPTLFIGESSGEVATAIDQGDCGRAVRPGESAELASRIVELCEARHECRRMGAAARSLLIRDYSLEAGVGRWLGAVGHLLPQQDTEEGAAMLTGALVT